VRLDGDVGKHDGVAAASARVLDARSPSATDDTVLFKVK
jgi:hypothetical protein